MQMDLLKTPPHSLEAETNILGSVLIEPDIFSSLLSSICADDFYLPRHQFIFQGMQEISKNNRPPDIVHLTNHLKDRNLLNQIGGPEYLSDLLNDTISTARAESYCALLKQKSIQRSLIRSCRDIQTKSLDNQFSSVDELLSYAQKQIQEIDNQQNSKNTLTEIISVIKTVIPEIEARSKSKTSIIGVSSGIQSLDFLTQGFKPSELVIVAARPSMGKTALSLNLAYNIAVLEKKRVAYFSVEMPKETLVMRMLASAAQIDLSRLQSGQILDHEWSLLIDRAGRLAETNFYIDDSNPLSPLELKSRCRFLQQTAGLDCVIVDYLQMMRVKNTRPESREREVAEISATLKQVAKELKVPVIALAQLNREADRRDGNRPVISDLRDSGSIEMDADIICMLYREDYYDKDNPEIKGNTELIVGKNRNGRTGTAKLKFISEINKFIDREAQI